MFGQRNRSVASALPVGTRIVQKMGLHQSGVIIERMPRIKFTDGQYRDPHSHEIATACYILWDDGTRGWIHSSFLRAA